VVENNHDGDASGPGCQPSGPQPASLSSQSGIPIAGDVFTVAYPFVRRAYNGIDFEGAYEAQSWRPGIEYREVDAYDIGDGPASAPFADGEGAAIFTVVDTHKPGRFPTRVFFTRKFRAPDGHTFGKPGLHIVTLEKFRRLVRGYGLGTGLAFEGPYHVAQGIEARSDETLQAAQPEGQEPGPKDAPTLNRDTPNA
jgi:hypothetical protein